MRRYRSFPTTEAIRLCHPFAYSLALLFVLSSFCLGQQAEPKKRVPRLTTDDVVNTKPVVQVVDETVAEAKADAKPEAGKPATAKAGSADAKSDPEELAWRERVEKARERAKAAQRDAEEGELRVTELRNQLGTSGRTPKDRNETAAELDQMGARLKDLRTEARTANAELQDVLSQGKQKSFTEAEGPKPTSEGGQPNEAYYKEKAAKLNEALQEADRRILLYENRVRDLSARINNPGADSFSNASLQTERDEALRQIEEARSARVKAREDLDALAEEARRAGVPPSVFR